MTQSFNNDQRPEKQLSPGTVIMERYLIRDVVGLGGMGSVYRAKDLHFPNVEKIVAVKEMINMAPDPLVRETIVQNFEREANILVTLSHPSIPQIFDYFTHQDRSYLVLEYVNGSDLEKILDESNSFMPEDQVIAWAVELCDVLSYLHNHKPEPIIFRDMKPSNIMVNKKNHIVLVDFGIAKTFKTGQKGTMIGTEGYSPPEQYRGEASPIADIYALGATIHHLLTKQDPRLEAPFTFHERPVKKVNPNVSSELEAVITTALQYDPKGRFQSAEAMKEALMMVAKKTGALNSAYFQTAAMISNDQGIKPLWTFTCEDEIRSSPIFHKGVVYFGSYDNNLYAVDTNEGEFMWKFPAEGGIVSRPAIQESLVLFGSEDHKLYAVSSRNGREVWNYPTERPIRSSPTIAEGCVFIGSDDGYLHAVSLATHSRLWRFDAVQPIRSTPLATKDFIYFGSDQGELNCVTYQGEIKWKFRAKRGMTSSPVISDGILYIASLDSSLYALDAKSGWMIWRFHMGKGSVSSPAIGFGNVYIGSADGNLYCVEAGAGREVWKYTTEHQVSGSPVLYKDAVYFGSVDGNVYCLDAKNGRFRWKFCAGGAITGTPYIENDVLYIGSLDHILYALMT
jgi:serine/threonine protein kinase